MKEIGILRVPKAKKIITNSKTLEFDPSKKMLDLLSNYLFLVFC